MLLLPGDIFRADTPVYPGPGSYSDCLFAPINLNLTLSGM